MRDEQAMKEDLRERILAYKRKDLQAMLVGGELPPTFGCLMFTDMDRGTALYEEDHYEARMLSTYLPTPISGLFAGGEAPLPSSYPYLSSPPLCLSRFLVPIYLLLVSILIEPWLSSCPRSSSAGQIARFNESHQLMENVCVAGILRAAEPRKDRKSVPTQKAFNGTYEQAEGLTHVLQEAGIVADDEESESEEGGEEEEEEGKGEQTKPKLRKPPPRDRPGKRS